MLAFQVFVAVIVNKSAALVKVILEPCLNTIVSWSVPSLDKTKSYSPAVELAAPAKVYWSLSLAAAIVKEFAALVNVMLEPFLNTIVFWVVPSADKTKL